METTKFLEKAAQQALCEVLGYDEGRMYYFLLEKEETEEEFSYSKKYRLLKSLFDLGAVGKIKPEGQEFFSYFLLPPSFLYANKIDESIINYLERIYLKNHNEFFQAEFSQFIVRNAELLLIFLLKHFMKEQARLMANEMNIGALGDRGQRVVFVKKGESRRKLGVIDGSMAFDFFNLMDKNNSDYVGYIARDSLGNGRKDYAALVGEEMNRA